jgi:phosphoribosylformylglycinamidine cyclo-ligase
MADRQAGFLMANPDSPIPKDDHPPIPGRTTGASYRDAGVDIDVGNETIRRIKSLARGTFTSGVLSEIGSFGGLFRLDRERYQEPVLVSSADGVGTKLKVAFMTGRHDTVGTDLVNHCVNDILVQGAEPLFFLDYLATGRLSPDVAEQVIAGVARGCRENGCALIGGETAEMPGFYADGEYDIAGFIVGVVEQSQLVDGKAIVPGDVLIGLPSAGLHTNGYSLARRVFFERAGFTPDTRVAELGTTVGEALLAPHRSYLSLVKPLLERRYVRGLAHITGGGITENLPRILPEGCAAQIDLRAWTVPPLFTLLQQRGGISAVEMFRAFNMGIGLIVVCAARDAERVINTLSRAGEQNAVRLGFVVSGDRTVTYL